MTAAHNTSGQQPPEERQRAEEVRQTLREAALDLEAMGRLNANLTAENKALRDAVVRLLAAWDAEDEQELNDLGEELWAAVRALRAAQRDGSGCGS